MSFLTHGTALHGEEGPEPVLSGEVRDAPQARAWLWGRGQGLARLLEGGTGRLWESPR